MSSPFSLSPLFPLPSPLSPLLQDGSETHPTLAPFARSAELCTPQIARASNFSPRDRSLHGATSRPAYTVFGHAKSFRLCALRSLGLSLACTLLRRAESQEFLDAGPENLTNNAATGRAETTYGASGLPTAGRFGKSRGESRRAKSRLGKHFGLRSGYARNRFPQRRYAPRPTIQKLADLPTKNYKWMIAGGKIQPSRLHYNRLY